MNAALGKPEAKLKMVAFSRSEQLKEGWIGMPIRPFVILSSTWRPHSAKY